MNDSLQILFEDNHCLAILKPAGLLTMGDDTGDDSAADLARRYLKDRYNKPGNVFLGVVHRLDRPVSGVLLFARTSKAASRLSDQFRRNTVRKHYMAVVEGRMSESAGLLTDWLSKDRERNHVSIVPKARRGAKECRLEYYVESIRDNETIVRLCPLTGRSHQIRVQLANQGHPIVGDLRYGAEDELGQRIMLHAQTLEFEHPTKKIPIVVESMLPAEFELAN
jgi:23S rRNA pseudouridine1911/1915/1917 synthase